MHRENDNCVLDDRPCTKTAACWAHGRCDGEVACRVASEADCEPSTLCRTGDKCNLLRYSDGSGGECAKDCADTFMCAMGGACSPLGAGCAVGGTEDCRQSRFCRATAKCTAVDGARGKICVTGDDDCKRTDRCETHGECTKTPENRCVAGSDADRKESAECREHGNCVLVDELCWVRSADP